MSRGMPSMVALLGLLAVAGYQNREKLAEMLGTQKQNPGGQLSPGDQHGNEGMFGKLGGLLGRGKRRECP